MALDSLASACCCFTDIALHNVHTSKPFPTPST